jgi:hypothetical protein
LGDSALAAQEYKSNKRMLMINEEEEEEKNNVQKHSLK